MGGDKLENNQAGQGEQKAKPSADQRSVSPTRSLMAWKGFRGWWDIHVLFPRAVGEVWGVEMEGPSEWSPKREYRWFPVESGVPQTPGGLEMAL